MLYIYYILYILSILSILYYMNIYIYIVLYIYTYMLHDVWVGLPGFMEMIIITPVNLELTNPWAVSFDGYYVNIL